MNVKIINYIRKYHSWELSGKAEAMQIFRAAYWSLNEAWPDLDEVVELKGKYTAEELIEKYKEWEENFSALAWEFYERYKDSGKFNLCSECGEIARSPTFERCELCGNTWKVNSDG